MATITVSKGITRFEQQANHSDGFMVRLCRNGKHINEFFSDSAYGTKTKARRAAEERYQELVEEYGPSTSMKGKLTKRNTTGLVGIHIVHSIDNRWPDCEYWAYCASWVNADGTRGKISFSWNKYGEKDAMELATIARKFEITDREKLEKMFERRKASLQKRKTAKRRPR